MKKLTIILTFILSFSLYAQEIAGADFRAFVHKVINSGDMTNYLDESLFEKSNLKSFLFENSKIEKAIQSGENINDLFSKKEITKALGQLKYKNLNDLIVDLNKKRTINQSRLFFENLNIIGHISEDGNLSAILKKSNLSGLTKELSKDINLKTMIKYHMSTLLKATTEISDENLNSFSNSQVVKKLVDSLNKNNFQVASKIYSGLDDVAKNKLLEKIPDNISSKVNSVIFEKLNLMDLTQNKAIAELTNAEFNMPDKSFKKLSQDLVSKYFNKDMPLETKWSILSEVLELTPSQHNSKLEVTVLKNSNIMFQKALQAAADKSESKLLKRLGKTLKAELTFLDEKDLKYALKKNFPDMHPQLKNLKQVAAGTTAVGCIAEFNGQKVFVKFLRPGLYEKIIQGRKRFLQIVGDNIAGRNIINSISDGVIVEISMVREAMNYEIAKLIYSDAAEGLDVPSIIKEFKPTKGSFVMEVADGKNVSKLKLSELSSAQLQKLDEASKRNLRRWFNVSMNLDNLEPAVDDKLNKGITEIYKRYFGVNPTQDKINSFKTMFNGDLHGGNVFIDFSDDYPKGYKVSWIDWGNSHTLNLEQIRGQVKLTLGAATKNKSTIIEAVKTVVKFTEDQEVRFIKSLDDYLIMAKQNGESGALVVNKAINLSLQSGATPPKEIINWARGKGMLETRLIDKIIPELNNRGIVASADDITRLYTKEMVSYILSNSPKQISAFRSVRTKARAETVLPLKTTGKFILDNINSLFTKTCSRLFGNKTP
jgi:hypothetical protein